MKPTIILALAAAAALSGCRTSGEILKEDSRDNISWTAFCAARGHHTDDNTYTTVNEYLDTWCGTIEEEHAFIKAGIENY